MPGGRAGDVVPTVVGGVLAAAALVLLLRAAPPARPSGEPAAGRSGELPAGPSGELPAGPSGEPAAGPDRRRFLRAGAAAAAVAAVGGAVGRLAQHARFDVSAARQRIALPRAPAPALPPGTDLHRGAVPWQTSADNFYRVDTALDLPQVDPATWSLRIHGMVERELRLDYAQLLRRPMIERWITLCCVSDPVGGGLIGNARWLGAPLADLLREAGVHAGADQLLMTSVDGMTIGAPTRVVLDGRDALLAVGMNGAPLPVRHGFPVRVVVPGLYGYTSACKWVTDIEATTFAARRAYWVQGGWAQQGEVKLASRIDTPRSGARVPVGRPVAVAGVAWDQHVGVSRVELQVDDGPWLSARLAAVPSTDTWRQWLVAWTPQQPGSHRLRVRASDAAGHPQSERRTDVYPSGATGLHTITVTAG